jgi:rhodanese-related sulfurtransferase
MKYFKLLLFVLSMNIFAFETNTKTLVKLFKDKKAIGLDVRSLNELKDNPAKGALHIPVDKLTSESLSKINVDKEIFVFCEAGYRADKAKKTLTKLGYKKVTNIKDWRTWNKVQLSLKK